MLRDRSIVLQYRFKPPANASIRLQNTLRYSELPTDVVKREREETGQTKTLGFLVAICGPRCGSHCKTWMHRTEKT